MNYSKNLTAGETAGRKKLTPEQMDNLVRVACEISEINSIIEKVHPENGCKKAVIFSCGRGSVAVVSHQGLDVREKHLGDPMTTTCDPQLFEVLADYFNDRKALLLEEVEAIMKEGGAE